MTDALYALMRPRRRTLVLMLAALLAVVPSAATAQPAQDDRVRVIVALDVSAGDTQALAAAQDALVAASVAANAVEVARMASLPITVLEVPRAEITALAADPRVRSVEVDRLVPPASDGTLTLIGAPDASAGGFVGSGVVVVVLDTGVDLDHPFVASAVVDGACFSTTRDGTLSSQSICPNGASQQFGRAAGRACPLDVFGCEHGTGVAGIIAGSAAESGISGVAPGARIVSVQVFSRLAGDICAGETSCALSWMSDQIRALDWVNTTLRPRYSVAAVNMSLGGAAFRGACDAVYPTMASLIGTLRANGIATIAAAGNGGEQGLSAPACISHAISVGSTIAPGHGPVDTVSRFSNTDTTLTLLAPGEQIRIAMPGGGYTFSQGTSVAAPHVAGAWAVLRAAKPSASPSEILAALTNTGLPITDQRIAQTTPRIQLDAALAALLSANSPLDGSAVNLSFGDQSLDTESQARSFTLANRGSAPISIGGLMVTGEFARNGGSCQPNAPLAPGATCTVAITFRPAVVGPRFGTLTIAAPSVFLRVPLVGNGSLSRLQIALPNVQS